MVITTGSRFTPSFKRCSSSSVHDCREECTYIAAHSQASPNDSQTRVYVLETFQADPGEATARASSGDRGRRQHLTS